MNKTWKIGTSIDSYVSRYEEWLKQGIYNFELSHDDSMILIKYSNGKSEKFTKSTSSQMLRVLLSLGLISLIGETNLQRDKSIIAGGKKYGVNSFDEFKGINNFLSSKLSETCERVFISKDLIYPSEKLFIFSLMASIYILEDKLNERFIMQKIEGTKKAEEFTKYYNKIAELLYKMDSFQQTMYHYKKYIVGHSVETEKFIKSINNNINDMTTSYFAEKNLKEQLLSRPTTFGAFVKNNFSFSNSIKIPVYQRKYVWDEDNVKTLLNDIKNTNENETHYIGNIITKDENMAPGTIEMKIIDGQQRITTLTLIARAMHDLSKYKGFASDMIITSRFNINSDDFVGKTFKKIEGNDDFSAFLQVVKGEALDSEKKIISSNIINIYRYILEWVSINLINEEEVKEFWDKLLNRIVFVLIESKTSNEYKLFEKLNTGGKDLTTIELFKNYILDIFSNENYSEEKSQKLFEKNIGGMFPIKTIDKEMDKFIITYLRYKYNKLNDDTLFNQYKDSLIQDRMNDDSDNLKVTIEKIGHDIEIYKSLSNYSLYSKDDAKFKGIADFLYMFDQRTVYYPLILKIIYSHSEDIDNIKISEYNIIRKYLRILEIFEVRLQIATYRGQSLSSKIEMILEHFNEKTTPEEFWDLISGGEGHSTSIPKIDEVVNSLSTQSIQNKPAKLIMTRLENYFYLKNNWEYEKDTHFKGIFSNKSNREHLLPGNWEKKWKNDLKSWTGISDEEKLKIETNKYVNFIGNAFPITEWSNKSIKDENLEKKYESIKKEAYIKDLNIFNGIENRLDAPAEKFTHKEILNRSKQIAEIAKEIWKDYK